MGTSVVLDRPPTDLDGAIAHQYRILDAMGVSTGVGMEDYDPDGIVVGALVGYGTKRELRGTVRELVDACGGIGSTICGVGLAFVGGLWSGASALPPTAKAVDFRAASV